MLNQHTGQDVPKVEAFFQMLLLINGICLAIILICFAILLATWVGPLIFRRRLPHTSGRSYIAKPSVTVRRVLVYRRGWRHIRPAGIIRLSGNHQFTRTQTEHYVAVMYPEHSASPRRKVHSRQDGVQFIADVLTRRQQNLKQQRHQHQQNQQRYRQRRELLTSLERDALQRLTE